MTSTLINQNQINGNRCNAIINGAMDIWQRGTATLTNPATLTFFPDRFKVQHTLGDGTYNLLRTAETPTATFPFQYSLQHATTHIETAVAAGEFSVIQYTIEGYDFKRFEGQTATLSFWVKSVKTGVFCLTFSNNSFDKSYSHEYTINSSNTWEKKTITLTFNSGGTFLYDNRAGLNLYWAIMNGSTLQMPTANKDAWQSGGYLSTDAQVNGMDNTNNKFYLTGVQMELGSVATPFEQRPYQQELSLCQRYLQRLSSSATYPYQTFALAVCSTTIRGIAYFPLRPNMRAAPVRTNSAANTLYCAGSILTSVTDDSISAETVTVNLNTTGLTANTATMFYANNTATAFIQFEAEL